MDSPNLERGAQLFEIGRYQDAIPYFQKALSENVDDFFPKYYLAQCYLLTDNLEKAYALATELRSLFPNEENIYFLLSQIYLHQENIKEAETNIDKAIELNPYLEDFFGQKAYTLLAKKDFEGALNYANEGLKINAKSIFCLNARTTALTKLNRKEEAKSSIENLLHDSPENAHSHANVGWSLLEHNNTPKALEHFKEALALDPNLEFARSGMVTAIKSKNKIYNLFLRYSFWISKKSEKNQWFVIIGFYLAYRFSVKILSATGLTYLAIPLMVIYLFVVLGTWIMEPLSNMILLLDSYGKYLLDTKERLSGQLFLGLIVASILAFTSSFILNNTYFTLIGLTCLAAILPITRGALSYNKRPQYINLAYGTIMLLAAIIMSLMGSTIGNIGLVVGIMFVGYTWLANFIK